MLFLFHRGENASTSAMFVPAMSCSKASLFPMFYCRTGGGESVSSRITPPASPAHPPATAVEAARSRVIVAFDALRCVALFGSRANFDASIPNLSNTVYAFQRASSTNSSASSSSSSAFARKCVLLAMFMFIRRIQMKMKNSCPPPLSLKWAILI